VSHLQGGNYDHINLTRYQRTLGVIIFALGSSWNDTVAQSMAIATFSFACIFFALESNDQLHSVFSRQTLESHKLIQMCGWSVLLVFLVTSLDFAHRLFATTDLNIGQWIACIVFGSFVLGTTEIEKFFRRRAEASSVTERETVSAAQSAA